MSDGQAQKNTHTHNSQTEKTISDQENQFSNETLKERKHEVLLKTRTTTDVVQLMGTMKVEIWFDAQQNGKGGKCRQIRSLMAQCGSMGKSFGKITPKGFV